MKTGFVLTCGRRQLFYESAGKNITKSVAEKFIDKIGELRGFSESFIAECKADAYTVEDLKRRTDRATLEKLDTGKIEYYRLAGKNFTECIPMEEADCLVIF